ncbi:MAG: antitoxin family protein [Nitrospirae bacterium]|nr:antitoxin family protein [Nitrospirota bacterium]
MPKPAPRTIEAVYEDGVFKPVRRVALPDRSRVRLTLAPLSPSATEKALVERQRKALLAVVGIGASNRTDISERHDEYLYGKKS